MKRKYNLIVWSLLGGLLAACDPMEDIYNEIDSKGNTITNTLEEYTLTDADYDFISKAALAAATNKEDTAWAKLVSSEKALNSFASGDKFVPSLLASLYPSWGNGSSVGVTYNFHGEQSDMEKALTGTVLWEMKSTDYDKVMGNGTPLRFFTPTKLAEKELPAALALQYADAEEGDFVAVDYKYVETEPGVTGTHAFIEEFEKASSDKGTGIVVDGWTQIQTQGKVVWDLRSYDENQYAQISANGVEGLVESWFVSPKMNVPAIEYALTFDLKYGYYNADCLDVLIATKFDGKNIHSGDWKVVTSDFPNIDNVEKPNKGYGKMFENVGKLSMKEYVGKDIYVAFRYKGEGPKKATTTVQIDNVALTTVEWTGACPEIHKGSLLFQFGKGNWKVYNQKDVLLVAPEDYDAMGEPGQEDCFSSSALPEEYLPAYLESKVVYPLEGNKLTLVYKYKSSDVAVMAKDYQYSAQQQWAPVSVIVPRVKEGYFCTGEKWIFDPSVYVVATDAHYQILVDWVAENKPAYLDKKYKDNTEYYFGASSHYKNFNIGLSTRRSNDPEGILASKAEDEQLAYLWEQVQNGVQKILEVTYPNAPAEVSGVELFYYFTCTVYENGGYYTCVYKFKSLGSGKFEYVSMEK